MLHSQMMRGRFARTERVDRRASLLTGLNPNPRLPGAVAVQVHKARIGSARREKLGFNSWRGLLPLAAPVERRGENERDFGIGDRLAVARQINAEAILADLRFFRLD